MTPEAVSLVGMGRFGLGMAHPSTPDQDHSVWLDRVQSL